MIKTKKKIVLRPPGGLGLLNKRPPGGLGGPPAGRKKKRIKIIKKKVIIRIKKNIKTDQQIMNRVIMMKNLATY